MLLINLLDQSDWPIQTVIVQVRIVPYGCLFSRVIYFRCFRGCIHDLRKLKKYQNFDPKNADSAMAKFSS